MGFPRIIYGASSDLIVDFDTNLLKGSGFNPFDKAFDSQADSGVEKIYHFFTQNFANLRFRHITPDVKAQLDSFKSYAEDGSTFIVELDRDLGGYWAFEGGVDESAGTNAFLDNNDGVSGSYTRSHVSNSASYINPGTGYLSYINTADIARSQVGKFGRSYLAEGSRTNIIGKSKTLTTAAGWNDLAATSVATTETLDPAGGTDAYLLTVSASSYANGFTWSTGVAVSTDDGCESVFLKAPSGTVNARLSLAGSTSGGNTKDVVVTTEWQRFQVAVDNGTDSPLGNWLPGVQLENSGDAVYWAFPQCEVGTEIKSASAYIESDAGGTVTRSADLLSYATTDLIDETQGTIGFWVRPQWEYDKHANAAFFWIDGVSGEGRLLSCYSLFSGGLFEVRLYDADGTNFTQVAPSASVLTQNNWHHIVVTWGSTLALYVDGTLLASTSHDGSFNRLGTNIDIGHAAATAHTFGDIDEFFITKTALNSTQINHVAQQGVSSYFGRNRITCRLQDKSFEIVPMEGGLYETVIPVKEVLT